MTQDTDGGAGSQQADQEEWDQVVAERAACDRGQGVAIRVVANNP